jgi:hypothetical protein
MFEYKDIYGTPCFTNDGWKTCQIGIKHPDIQYIGDLSNLNITDKNTYIDQINYYMEHPIEFIEMSTGLKLKWYQKLVLKTTLKNNKRRN